MTLDYMKDKLRKTLNQGRCRHSLRVMEEADRLALHYGVDRTKAAIAGLLHDCAKYIKDREAIDMLNKKGVVMDNIQKKSPSLFHSILGPFIASDIYGVTDKAVLDAIYWHTTGRAGMTPLEKIIFVSDYIECGRSFSGVDEARIMAYKDINRCILICTDSTIKHIIKKGRLIHPNTIDTRNEALTRILEEFTGL